MKLNEGSISSNKIEAVIIQAALKDEIWICAHHACWQIRKEFSVIHSHEMWIFFPPLHFDSGENFAINDARILIDKKDWKMREISKSTHRSIEKLAGWLADWYLCVYVIRTCMYLLWMYWTYVWFYAHHRACVCMCVRYETTEHIVQYACIVCGTVQYNSIQYTGVRTTYNVHRPTNPPHIHWVWQNELCTKKLKRSFISGILTHIR